MTSQASYENAVGEAEASEAASASEKLQRHRSYHFSQTKPSKTRKSSSRRATSVRVKPTFLEDEDPNLPEPPVCIKVASPEPEEDLEDKVEHTNTLRLVL